MRPQRWRYSATVSSFVDLHPLNTVFTRVVDDHCFEPAVFLRKKTKKNPGGGVSLVIFSSQGQGNQARFDKVFGKTNLAYESRHGIGIWGYLCSARNARITPQPCIIMTSLKSKRRIQSLETLSSLECRILTQQFSKTQFP